MGIANIVGGGRKQTPSLKKAIVFIIKTPQKKAEGYGKLAPVFLEGTKFVLENQWISVNEDLPCNHKELLMINNQQYSETFEVFAINKYGDIWTDCMINENGKWRWHDFEPDYWMIAPITIKRIGDKDMRKEKIIDYRGKTCEECIFLPLYRKMGNALYKCKNCEYKSLFTETDNKKLNNKNKSVNLLDKSNIFDKCKNCNYFSHKEGYKPHCHYKKVKKSPIIDDNFKCPKE